MLKCSKSGYYSWDNSGRPKYNAFNKEVNDLIVNQYYSDTRQGILRIIMNIKAINRVRLTNHTIYRYMRLNNIQSITRKKKRRYPKVPHHKIKNLLQKDFTTEMLNQKWSIDVSFLPSEGKLQYLCAIKDLYDKSIVAYNISDFNDNQLIIKTVKEAIDKSPLHTRKGLILHSDQGVQLTSYAYTDL